MAPAGKCIHENTLIKTPNGLIPAKLLEVGDAVYTVEFEELANQDVDSDEINYINFNSETLVSNSGLVETVISNKIQSTKDSVMYFNNEEDVLFSLEQPMFVKRNNEYEVIPSGVVEEGDILLKISDSGGLLEVLVEQITVIEEESTVYLFDCEPQDWFIAGGYLVHNK